MTYYDLLMVLVVMILLLSEASPASVPSRHGRFCLAGIFAVVELSRIVVTSWGFRSLRKVGPHG